MNRRNHERVAEKRRCDYLESRRTHSTLRLPLPLILPRDCPRLLFQLVSFTCISGTDV